MTMMTWDDTSVTWDDLGISWLGDEPFVPDVPYTPLPRVYIAPGYTWRDDPSTFVWQELTSMVRSCDITMGRAAELDQFDAGTCTVVLRDADRTLDPTNTAGPFYGQLLPNMPVKVEAAIIADAPVALTDSSGDELTDHNGAELTTDAVTVGAITVYPRFYGYMDGLSIVPSNANRVAYVTIQATDGFKLLAERPLPSPYETAVLDLGPDLYWPLGSDEVGLDRSGNERHIRFTPNAQTVDRVAPYGGPGSKSSPIDEPVARIRVAKWENPLVLDTRVGISFWFQANSTVSSDETLLLHFWPWFHILAYPSVPDVFVEFGDSTMRAGFRADIFDGEPHHIFVARDDAATWVYGGTPGSTLVASTPVMVYVDGVTTYPYNASGKVPISANVVAAVIGPSNYLDGSPVFDGAISDVSLHIGPEWTRDTPRELYMAGTKPWDGDTPGQRINRVLDVLGWPTSLRDIDDGNVILGPADVMGEKALDHLQRVAATEHGRLYMSRDGKVTFRSAAQFLTSRATSVMAVFDDQGAPTLAGVSEATWRFDDEFVFDRVVVTREGGRPQTAETHPDPTRTKELSGLLMVTDQQAKQLAERIAWRYRQPQLRCDGWAAKPERNPESWPSVLDLRFGDRVRLYRTRTNDDTQDFVDLYLESASERFDRNEWVFTQLTGAPIDPHGYFRWDTAGGWDSSHWF